MRINVKDFFDKEFFVLLLIFFILPFIHFLGNIIGLLLIFLGLYFLFKNNFIALFKVFVYFSIYKHFNPFFAHPNTNLFIVLVLLLSFLFFVLLIKFASFKKPFYLFKLEKLFYILYLIILITSLLGSKYVDLSIIRLFIVFVFTFVTFTIYKLVNNYKFVEKFFIKIYMLIAIFSMFLLPFHQGYLGNTGFFKGIINHSQDFGVIFLPLFTYYSINFFLKRIEFNFLSLFLFFIGLIELYLTHSRGAMFGYILVLLIFVFVYFKYIWLSNFKKTIFLASLAGLFVIFNYHSISNGLISYIYKYKISNQSGGFENKVLASREMLIEDEKNNFYKHPLVGIGFNVQTWYQDPFVQANVNKLTKYIPGTHIMYSRPLEKGDLYLEVLEEDGIFAFLVFVFILIYLLRATYPYLDLFLPLMAMFFNFNAEASLFSPSGPGNFQMIFIVGVYFIAINRKKERYEI